MAKRRRWLIPVILLALACVGGGVTVALWPDDPELAADGDTGMGRDESEEFMRVIGYVQ